MFSFLSKFQWSFLQITKKKPCIICRQFFSSSSFFFKQSANVVTATSAVLGVASPTCFQMAMHPISFHPSINPWHILLDKTSYWSCRQKRKQKVKNQLNPIKSNQLIKGASLV